ncbi:MAG TPA: hypothetical protein VJ596_02510 [Gemmatimonadaceae bacterium]|nr:hypothetical protein [Gemmatimonadaceae bacterium]
MTLQRARFDAWLPTALLLAGSICFLGGGSRHPRVNETTMPAAGTEEYFRHFAEMMLSMPNWELIHTLLLAGPVLWALGASGATRLLGRRASVLGEVGRTALLAGAGLWALAFVLDGYVGPRHARTMLAAGAGSDATAIATFGANAFTMARLGMISVVLIAASAINFGVALLLDTGWRSWRAAVGLAGGLLGAGLLVAALRGEFHPGPFTSVHWTAMAAALGVWFLLFGTTLPGLSSRKLDEAPD